MCANACTNTTSSAPLELEIPFERYASIGVLTGETDLEKMLRERLRAEALGTPKVKIDTKIEFDDSCSSRSTLAQVIAQDRPGLLHRISSCLSHEKCNIEIALIDTEGQMAIDVFYLTSSGAKLSPEHERRIHKGLTETLKADS